MTAKTEAAGTKAGTAAKTPSSKTIKPGHFVTYTDRTGHTYPALVTLTKATFDAELAGSGFSGPKAPYGAGTISVIVFRPSGRTYVRHNVERKAKATAGERSWKPLA